MSLSRLACVIGRYGGIGGFLTPNVADTRNPVIVVLHQGCTQHPEGGFTEDGVSEKFEVSLLDEAPSMPHAGKMLEILASNPVVQARFFVFSMRLFLQHILGIMQFDDQLRPNGSRNGVSFPDGMAASFTGGAFCAIAQLHGPIEEQARLSCHPHIVLHFVNAMSQQWLRGILQANTADAKQSLRKWQIATLEAVESLMSSCAGLFTLHFKHVPFAKEDLLSLPYHSKWQQEDKFDGEAEDCQKDPSRVRDLVPVVAPFVDLHLRGDVGKRQVPLTGSTMSRLPHYRLLRGGFSGCQCRVCEHARTTGVCLDYAKEFEADLHGVCSLSGHLHEHQQTCFKYTPENSRKKPQHCRFNFVHFVKLFRERKILITSGSGHPDEVCEKIRLKEIVVARTGKELVLPRWLGKINPVNLSGEHFEGRSDLGSAVEDAVDTTQRGRIKTVQYNPREGQCFPVTWRC